MNSIMIYTIRETVCATGDSQTYLFTGTLSQAMREAMRFQHSTDNTLSIEWPEHHPIAIRENGMWRKA